jgi:hypothetical protein
MKEGSGKRVLNCGSAGEADGMVRKPVDPSLAPLPDKIPFGTTKVSSPEENW